MKTLLKIGHAKMVMATVLSIVALSLFTSLSAQVNYFYQKGERVTLELRQDLIYVESKDNFRSSVVESFADSVLVSTAKFTIMKINTRRTNAEGIARHSGVTRFANVLEYKDGTLQVPTGGIFVSPKTGVSFEKALEELRNHNVKVISSKPVYENSNVLLVELDMELNNIFETVNSLSKSARFEFVEPNFLRLIKRASPYTNPFTNPLFIDQWGHENTGQNGGTPGIDINVRNAWNNALGNGVRVAVIDEGVELTHPDLAANILSHLGYDATDGGQGGSGGSPQLSTNDAHGTACAGIIAAVDNDIGVMGVSPNAGIVPVRIAYSNWWGGWTTYDDWIAAGLRHAWQNADVLNNSWGGGSNSILINNEIDSALIHGRNGKGTVIVFAAGNYDGSVLYPANAHPNIIAVGAMSPCGERKSDSSCDGEYRWGSNYGTELDVVAPGVLIPTTDLTGSFGYNPNLPIHVGSGGNLIASDYANMDYTVWFNGTSSAAPHVAGVAALILSVNPDLTQRQVADIIESTARKLDGYLYANDPTRPNGDWNYETGYGLIDAYAAVQAALQTIEPPPTVSDTVIFNFAGADSSIIDSLINITPAGVTVIIRNPDYLNGAMISLRNLGLEDSVIVEWYGDFDQNNANCASRYAELFGNGAQINNFVSPKLGNGDVVIFVKSATAQAYTTEIKIYNWMNGQGCPAPSRASLGKQRNNIEGFAPLVVDSRSCGADGSDLTCTREDTTLTISGTGAMVDYPNPSDLFGPGGDAGLWWWGHGVKSVVVENGVTHIAAYAFSKYDIREVTVSAETPPAVGDGAFDGLEMPTAILHVPQGSINAYRTADVWKDFGFINPSTVTFDLQGGSGDIDSQFLTYGGKATKPTDPTKGDINFAGWYKEASGTTPWNFETDSVTQDITLFAKWEPTSSIASRDRNINSRPSQDAAVIAPVSVTAFEFAAGPNPVRKTDGLVNIFITGKRVDSGVLTVYDAAGNAVSKIAIRDDAVLGNIGRRVVGSWNLRDDKGRAVSEGTYLLRGTLKTVDGKRERVSVIIGVR